MMIDIDNELKKIAEAETTDISYHKVQSDNDTLVVSFAGWGSRYFQMKTSLLNISEECKFDTLFLRNHKHHWYLGKLKEIGTGVNEIKNFLKKQISTYNKIIFVGSSMGGYGALLYGSLLDVDFIVAPIPQTDLRYVRKHIPKNREYRRVSRLKDYQKYKNLNNFISKKTKYFVTSRSEKRPKSNSQRWDYYQHNFYQCENILNLGNVTYLGVTPTEFEVGDVAEFVKNKILGKS